MRDIKVVKMVLKSYLLYQKNEGLPYSSPNTLILLKIRANQERPFKPSNTDFLTSVNMIKTKVG